MAHNRERGTKKAALAPRAPLMPGSDPTPLRICLVVSYFHPFESGAERQALAQAIELVRRGHSVHVVTHAVYGVPTEEEISGIQVHRWIRSWKSGPLFGPTFVSSTILALLRLRRHYDLIHTHQALWEAVSTGAAHLGGIRGVPTVVQPASSGFYGEAQELLRTRGANFLRRLILRNDALVAISADIENEWLALGVPASKITKIASGVDHRQFAPGDSRAEASLPGRPRVMFTGRLHPQKNLDILIEAWPEVAAATGASLILVGDGPERERLAAKAGSLGIEPFVHFNGVTDDPADLLKAADLFVLPSLAEGMSNSLLEAMATALPCVASDIGGNQDLLKPSDAGVLIAEPSPNAWARELVALIQDPERRARLGANARKRIEDEYALEHVVDRYVELYRRLLSRKKARP